MNHYLNVALIPCYILQLCSRPQNRKTQQHTKIHFLHSAFIMPATKAPSETSIPISYDETGTLNEVVLNTRSSLHAVVDARKEAERDAQLLLNRIHLLKNEEMKVMKQASLSNAKSEQLAAVRRDAAMREMERRRVELFQKEQASKSLDRNQYLREVGKANRELSKKEVEAAKQRVALETRLALQRKVENRIGEEAAERQRRLQRTEAIKQDRIESRKRIEEEKMARLRSFHRDFEAKLMEEEQLKRKNEALIAQLEREEMELIQRLQHAQEAQSYSISTPSTPAPSSSKKSLSSARKTPLVSPHVAAPTISSLSRRDVGGAALR